MAGYDEFQRFKDFKVMDKKSIDFAANYVCLQLMFQCFKISE